MLTLRPSMPAHPNIHSGSGTPGISIRDYMATHILSGILAGDLTKQADPETAIRSAYDFADAMIEYANI